MSQSSSNIIDLIISLLPLLRCIVPCERLYLSCFQRPGDFLSWVKFVFVAIQCKCHEFYSRLIWGSCFHDDFIEWKHFQRYWNFVREIHWSLLHSTHTKASDTALWYFVWSVPEQTVKQTLETPKIWDAIAHYDVIAMSNTKFASNFKTIVNIENILI